MTNTPPSKIVERLRAARMSVLRTMNTTETLTLMFRERRSSTNSQVDDLETNNTEQEVNHDD